MKPDPYAKRTHWRNDSSPVTAAKTAYRTASKGQREQIRAWMRRVLTNEDGNC